jgi:pimeloyl-ACP methyl ester carboxylesterase
MKSIEYLIDIDDCVLFVKEQGKGPVLFCSHSLFCDSQMFNEMTEILSLNFRIITIDARAHGKSSIPTSNFTIENLANDLLKVMDKLSIAKAFMLGISMGAMIALNCTLLEPNRTLGLLLLDTEARKPPFKNWLERWLLAKTAPVTGIKSFSVNAILLRMFGSTFRRKNPLIIEEWRHKLSNLNPRAMALSIDAINNRPPLINRLSEIKTPTLLIYGDEDLYTPLSSGELIQKNIPDSEMKIIKETGHLSIVEKPNEIATIVNRFCQF